MDASLTLEDWLGRDIDVVVDRPLGDRRRAEPAFVYEVNCGYVPDTDAADGYPLDVYVLGATERLELCTARVVAIVRRRDDVKDKLVAAVAGEWDEPAIRRAVDFQERYFDSFIELCFWPPRPTSAPASAA